MRNSAVEKYGPAIRQIESGGNYSARGPVVKSGRYAGERAMGAYQVMPGNLPQWSQRALGRVVSEREFMASRAIQDAIFEDQFGRNARAQGGSNAASIWHSGSNLARARSRGATDGYTATTDYVARFDRLVGGTERVTPNARQGVSNAPADEGAVSVELAVGQRALAAQRDEQAEGLQRAAELQRIKAASPNPLLQRAAPQRGPASLIGSQLIQSGIEPLRAVPLGNTF